MTKRYRLPQVFMDDPDRVAASRTCGTCTACCSCPSLAVPDCKPFDGSCVHLRRGRAKSRRPGCAIYDARPDYCKSYSCYWRLGVLGRNDRPDRLGIIFDTAGEPVKRLNKMVDTPVVLAREVYPGSSAGTIAKAAILAVSANFAVIRVGVAAGPIVHSESQTVTDKVIAAIETIEREERGEV